MTTTISALGANSAARLAQTGPQVTTQDAQQYLGTRSMNDLVKSGTKIKWEQLPEGGMKYGDLGDVPADTKVIYLKLPPFKGEVMYAMMADSATDSLGQIVLGTYDGNPVAWATSEGRGRWDKTMVVDP